MAFPNKRTIRGRLFHLMSSKGGAILSRDDNSDKYGVQIIFPELYTINYKNLILQIQKYTYTYRGFLQRFEKKIPWVFPECISKFPWVYHHKPLQNSFKTKFKPKTLKIFYILFLFIFYFLYFIYIKSIFKVPWLNATKMQSFLKYV